MNPYESPKGMEEGIVKDTLFQLRRDFSFFFALMFGYIATFIGSYLTAQLPLMGMPMWPMQVCEIMSILGFAWCLYEVMSARNKIKAFQ